MSAFIIFLYVLFRKMYPFLFNVTWIDMRMNYICAHKAWLFWVLYSSNIFFNYLIFHITIKWCFKILPKKYSQLAVYGFLNMKQMWICNVSMHIFAFERYLKHIKWSASGLNFWYCIYFPKIPQITINFLYDF